MSAPSIFPWLGLGAAIAVLSASTLIGWWHFNAAVELGWPIYKSRLITIYAPWSAIGWWSSWSADPAFRETFINGLWTAGFVGMMTSALVLHMVRSFGPLPRIQAEEQPERYGTVRELLESDRISMHDNGIVLGRDGNRIIYHTGDDHVLLVGASRVGEKGVSFVLPTLADCPDSMVVFDPKGELHEATADERAKLGPVYLMDPTRPGTSRFNPLLEMRMNEQNIGDCRALAALMTHDMHGRDPFWATKAAALIAACLRIVSIDGGRCTLERVRRLVMEVGQGHAPETSDRFAHELIAAHLAMEMRPRTGVDAQAQLALDWAGDPMVASSVASSEFQVIDLCAREQPCTVYLTLPASQSQSLKQLARVVLQALLLGMLHSRTTVATRQFRDGLLVEVPKRRRVVWLLDEFPALGHLPFIESGLAVAAGYGLKAMLVAQSVEQIKETYGQNETIIGNIGTMAWVPSLSKASYEEAAAAAGTIIAALRARHRKVGILDRPSETVGQSRHPVLNPRELAIRSRDEALIFHAGSHPTWLHKCRWYQHPAYAGRIKDVHTRYGS